MKGKKSQEKLLKKSNYKITELFQNFKNPITGETEEQLKMVPLKHPKDWEVGDRLFWADREWSPVEYRYIRTGVFMEITDPSHLKSIQEVWNEEYLKEYGFHIIKKIKSYERKKEQELLLEEFVEWLRECGEDAFYVFEETEEAIKKFLESQEV